MNRDYNFRWQANRGFTVTELLIAVGIIALLAGLLLPVLSGAMGGARQAQCVNNLSQIMKTWSQWGRDNAFSSPAGGEQAEICMKAMDASGSTWAEKIAALSGEDILRCPEREGNDYGYGLNPLHGAEWSYSIGAIGQGYLLTPGETRPCLRNLIVKPSQTLIFCENGYVTDSTLAKASTEWEEDPAQPWQPYAAFNFTSTTSDPFYTPPTFGYDWGNSYSLSGVGSMGWDKHYRAVLRHPKVSSSFADGHVETRDIAELTDPIWGAKDCLYDNESTP